MTDEFMKHFISFLVTLLGLVIYIVGYSSGRQGWWFTVLGLVVLYFLVLKLIDA